VLGYLEAALPQHRVMAQVAMGALLEAAETDRKRAHGTRNRFAQKIVDFVVVSRDTAEVLALVELDDRTHRAARDAKRDAMTASAGYSTIRILSRPRPSPESVRSSVAHLNIAPHGHV
jgi:very-short-patch-repair endonuclease